MKHCWVSGGFRFPPTKQCLVHGCQADWSAKENADRPGKKNRESRARSIAKIRNHLFLENMHGFGTILEVSRIKDISGFCDKSRRPAPVTLATGQCNFSIRHPTHCPALTTIFRVLMINTVFVKASSLHHLGRNGRRSHASHISMCVTMLRISAVIVFDGLL